MLKVNVEIHNRQPKVFVGSYVFSKTDNNLSDLEWLNQSVEQVLADLNISSLANHIIRTDIYWADEKQ